MAMTYVWVHFDGPRAHRGNRIFQQYLDKPATPGKVPPDYELLEWEPAPPKFPNSTNLKVSNHGGPIDPKLIAQFVQDNICAGPGYAITAGIIGTVES